MILNKPLIPDYYLQSDGSWKTDGQRGRTEWNDAGEEVGYRWIAPMTYRPWGDRMNEVFVRNKTTGNWEPCIKSNPDGIVEAEYEIVNTKLLNGPQ